MARQTDNLIYYAVIGGVTYLAYKLALDGQLGADAQKAAKDAYHAITGEDYQPVIGGLPPGTEPTRLQWGGRYDLWTSFAQSYSLNPCDWQSFRNWLGVRGEGDPGAKKPSWAC